ncbi:hypothetical protein F7734_35580 [Scytonema sp. UIC 10036]|uniref:hypothetical protein n=1 Tax=Scytonema sp. UIC 10036 TaxID=2304196 RepID=UPI0012DA79E7|nr:hypothetical protein [Scytonema sp. UIC 10036]MUG97367.1 hypothetical protein [Scytonema sp. UIC 10036]
MGQRIKNFQEQLQFVIQAKQEGQARVDLELQEIESACEQLDAIERKLSDFMADLA